MDGWEHRGARDLGAPDASRASIASAAARTNAALRPHSPVPPGPQGARAPAVRRAPPEARESSIVPAAATQAHHAARRCRTSAAAQCTRWRQNGAALVARDQAITKIRIAFRNSAHVMRELTTGQARTGFRPTAAATPCKGGWGWGSGLGGAYSSRGSISWAKLFRARLRRLFTVPRLQPVNVGDLGVALAFQLAEHEHGPMVGGSWSTHWSTASFRNRLRYSRRAGRGVFELEWPVVRLPVLLDRLEQHQGVTAAVPKLVLREVRRDGIDPGRDFLV